MTAAQIHDQGYRRYDGERLGVVSAISGLTTHGVMRVLGIRRPAKNKILPGIVLVIAFLPAVVFVGMAVLLSDLGVADIPNYSQYYGFIGMAVLVFVAFAAPEGLNTDRSSGMLSLYLASPLTRLSYLFSRCLALALVLMTVTVAPLLLMMISYTLIGYGPDGFLNWFETFGRIVLAGTAATIPYVAIGTAASLVAKRRSYASATIVVVLLASNVISSLFFFSLRDSDPSQVDTYSLIGLFDLLNLPFVLAGEILGFETESEVHAQLNGWEILGANVLWTALFVAVSIWAMRRLSVDR